MNIKTLLTTMLLMGLAAASHAESGRQLWLRYTYIGKAEVQTPRHSPTIDIAVSEIHDYYQGSRVVFQPADMPEGAFRIGGDTIWAQSDAGFLYGAYALLRHQATQAPSAGWGVTEVPAVRHRILNHWDNLDGSIERGYAGRSIFFPSFDPEVIRAYARANASIGINGSVLNNVNASPDMLTASYLKQVKAIADILRPYGIRAYLSVNFGTPKALGATRTADPLDRSVIRWWQRKAAEIYRLVPDFGGFLVKASSEGQPGPNDYGRTHAEGANMLADALKPYGGLVIWRSFVYGANHKGEDRVMQAVSEFKPLDGKFRDNVILQSKNGPLDFQPREPYAPIFDNMKQTPQMAELQVTQEYTGQSRHLVYLGTMWQEFFGYVTPERMQGIAGVANIGNDADWCGHQFSQANWYAFGRMAWQGSRSDARSIAEEWVVQTFSDNYRFVKPVTQMMMTSREACVDYMMPLGLHHIFAFDHHYGPEPDGFKAEYPLEWCPVYYHKADSAGIGFDRSTSGSGATQQYPEPYRTMYDQLSTCPESYLLWFHHVPWDYRMKNGKTLWANLVDRYHAGVSQVDAYHAMWQDMRPYVDAERWQAVDRALVDQQANARQWRDTCLKYFGRLAGQGN